MNFITELLMSEDYNAIYTIIDQLLKKRHYISCYSGDKETSTKKVIKLIL